MTLRSIKHIVVVCFVVTGNLFADTHNVPDDFPTIAEAIAASSSGDTIILFPGNYTETFTISKAISLIGSGTSSTKINGSITISANSVTCKDFTVRSTGIGISASGVSNLSLINIYSRGNGGNGAQLSNISTLTITGGIFSTNHNVGINIATASNVSISNVTADSNGVTGVGSGIYMINITGTSTVANVTARKNYQYGVVVSNSSDGVVINGGTYSTNGTTRGTDGAGIYIFTTSGSSNTKIKNITINGPITANDNLTAGIWLDCEVSSDTILNTTIGSFGTVSMTNNGGAGVLVYGNMNTTTITGTFDRGSVSAAGVIVIGTSSVGNLSPRNTVINNSTFKNYLAGAGTSGKPAITLYDNNSNKCTQNVSGTGNTFVGFPDSASIEGIIYHKPDDNILGLVTLTNNNPLPVELSSFTAKANRSVVQLDWTTATEVNNAGWEVQRTEVSSQFTNIYGHPEQVIPMFPNRENASKDDWERIGYVEGNGSSNIQHGYSMIDKVISAGTYAYRLKQIDRDGAFTYSNEVSVNISQVSSSDEPSLDIYPNPFNSSTIISFSVPESSDVSVVIYDVIGRVVATLYNRLTEATTIQKVRFDASHTFSGIYFCRLTTGKNNVMKKILLLK